MCSVRPFFLRGGGPTSWVWVRTWAFAKLSAVRGDPTPFMIGDPVCGILERVGPGDYSSSQIVDWEMATFDKIFFRRAFLFFKTKDPPHFEERRLSCARMFPTPHISTVRPRRFSSCRFYRALFSLEGRSDRITRGAGYLIPTIRRGFSQGIAFRVLRDRKLIAPARKALAERKRVKRVKVRALPTRAMVVRIIWRRL